MSIEPSVRLGKRSPLALTMKRPMPTLRKWLVAFLWCMTVILWVRSLWVGDRLMIRTKSTYMGIVSGDGRLCLFECARSDPAFSNFGTGCVDFGTFDADLWGRFNGDRNSYFTWENTGLIRYNAAMPELKRPGNLGGLTAIYALTLYIPFLVPFLAFSTAVGIQVRRFLREQMVASRRSANRCVSCGYDLCATPGRCPECGAIPAGKAKTSN
ncbi:MAG: hypothetical protein JWL69_612 [Phycisphaerales bacterium]|nr:hypothetical protein [Phycisphaerales bacterium]